MPSWPRRGAGLEGWTGPIAEAILLVMVCLSPWAFGAVVAWAELALYFGIAGVAVLGALAGRGTNRTRSMTCVPSLALIGLILLATAQVAAWPGRLVRGLVPWTASFKASLGPESPVRVLDDLTSPVPPPGPASSLDPDLSVDSAVRLAAGWALLQAALVVGRRPGAFRRLGLALAINSTFLALFAMVQTLSWNGRMYWVFPEMGITARGGPFVNKNHLAAYLNLGLGFALAALVVPGPRGSPSEGRGRRLPAAYAAGLMVAGVLSSHSRGGFVAMVAATVVLLVLAKPRAWRIGAGLAAMLAMAAAFQWGVGAPDSLRRIATVFQAGSLEDRLGFWKGALRAWSSCPVQGVGLGTFAFTAARFFGHDDGIAVMHAENEYLELLAEGGVIGLALGLLLLTSLARLGLGARASVPDLSRRMPILGALFGAVALATHCLSDFPMHIPAIAVTAAILAAFLIGAGLDARAQGAGGPDGPTPRRALVILAVALPVALSLVGVRHGLAMARSEAALAGSGVPTAGAEMPSTTLWDEPMPTLERARLHLGKALRSRPDWAEGHARLGLILLSQYRAAVMGLVAVEAGDPRRAEAMADPLWLHGVVHSATPDQLAAAGGVLAHEPVRKYLAPAARSFLEARRCCPVWGLPHAELASLDFLISGGESTSTHARRALRLAGNDVPTIAIAARASAQSGDLRLAALGWREILRARDDESWKAVADQAGALLSPGQILDWVLPDGRYALWFADRLYDAPANRPARDRFLEWAVDRLAGDEGLPLADRHRFGAQALARLGRSDAATGRMLEALALEPGHPAWRKELVGWLLAWGKPEEAHDQALIGLYLAPDDPDARRAVELSAEALARGPLTPGAPPPR
jgi:O-antigen ligase